LKLEFDPFVLTKMQKNVSRFLGGYLAKEWETNGPAKKMRFEKQSARALVADVHQQENLNDCGVFVLENTLRSISMQGEFLKSMAGASPQVLRSFPWPSQEDITARKEKLKAITARLFAAATDKGTTDLDAVLKDNSELRAEVLASLTDMEAREANLKAWAGNLQKELASRQQDKDAMDAEAKRKEEQIQARKMEAQMKKEDEERQRQEDIKAGKIKALPKVGKRRHISSRSSGSRSRSRSDRKRRTKTKRRTDESDCSGSSSGQKRKPKEKDAGRKPKPKPKKRKGSSASDSRSQSEPSEKPVLREKVRRRSRSGDRRRY